MQEVTPGRRRLWTVLALAITACAMLVAACGSKGDTKSSSSSTPSTTTSSASTPAPTSSSTSSDITPTEQATLLKNAFYTDKIDNPSPVLLSALKTATTPLTSEQSDTLKKCMAATTCETGTGSLTLGIADSFGDIPWRVQARVEQTAQAIQSGKVAKIIYTNGHADLQKSQANFRSLLAQKVDVISAYYDFASAMTSLFRQAQRQGTVVTSYISNIPHGDGKSDGIEFAANVPSVAKSMADAGKAAVPSGGNAALFTGVPGNPTGAIWEPVVQKELEAAGWKVVYKGNTSWTPAGELSATSAAIAKGQKIDAIFYDGAGPVNLMKGFQRAGAKMPAVISWSPDNTYYNLWKKLGQPTDNYITDSQTWTGRVAVQAAIDRASGETVPGQIELPQPLVQTKAAEPFWGPNLKFGTAYLPPTFSGDVITEFNK
jgi:ABC-type sugar transport system substrate-binding protein